MPTTAVIITSPLEVRQKVHGISTREKVIGIFIRVWEVFFSEIAETAPSVAILKKLSRTIRSFNRKRRRWIVSQEVEAQLFTCLATIETAGANHPIIDVSGKEGTRIVPRAVWHPC